MEARAHGLPKMNKALTGALFAAAGFGLIIGVYEACWTLLLQSRGAHNWQIGLSWTMFAVPFAAMAKPAGWLTDHFDRRVLAISAIATSVVFCVTYPFVANLWLLLVLGGLEAVGVSIGMPAIQSLLTQGTATEELGRVQGLFSTCETGAIAVSAAAGGALFGLAIWAPFITSAASCFVVVAMLPFLWRTVAGRVRDVLSATGELAAEVPTALNA
jgi:MFS family permease